MWPPVKTTGSRRDIWSHASQASLKKLQIGDQTSENIGFYSQIFHDIKVLKEQAISKLMGFEQTEHARSEIGSGRRPLLTQRVSLLIS
jgi:hypothetical protein